MHDRNDMSILFAIFLVIFALFVVNECIRKKGADITMHEDVILQTETTISEDITEKTQTVTTIKLMTTETITTTETHMTTAVETEIYSEETNYSEETLYVETNDETLEEFTEQIPNDVYYDDAIIIKDESIPITYGPATQENVDTYDVVQDTEYFSSSNETVLFGHVNKSFEILDSVCVGERIVLRNHGYEKGYIVERSELATLSPNGKNILFLTDNEKILYKDFDNETIILVTCTKDYVWERRWVVIATIESLEVGYEE